MRPEIKLNLHFADRACFDGTFECVTIAIEVNGKYHKLFTCIADATEVSEALVDYDKNARRTIDALSTVTV